MSHTITITRLPDAENDDAEYTIGGGCDRACSVWRECDERHPRATLDELTDGEATWHGVEHMLILGSGWCVQTNECGLDFCHDLSSEAERVTGLGEYALDVEYDGDGWDAIIGDPITGDCPHDNLTGAEGPIAELGRWPRRWTCDACGALVVDSESGGSQ